jgi:hypothetical protein
MLTGIREGHPRPFQEGDGRSRQKNFSRPGQRHDPGCNMDCYPVNRVNMPLHLPRMDTYTHFNPILFSGPANSFSAADSPGGAVENGQEPISRGLDRVA